jgi:hypothetical protein
VDYFARLGKSPQVRPSLVRISSCTRRWPGACILRVQEGRQPVSIATLRDLMIEKNIRHVPVVDDDDSVVGLVRSKG